MKKRKLNSREKWGMENESTIMLCLLITSIFAYIFLLFVMELT